MTNCQIITAERLRLMDEGRLQPTGRRFMAIIVKNGEKVELELDEPEEIHTFKAWRDMGYGVKKGEKAVARFAIWKYAERVTEGDDGEEQAEKRMFMKEACFFAQHQVERRG